MIIGRSVSSACFHCLALRIPRPHSLRSKYDCTMVLSSTPPGFSEQSRRRVSVFAKLKKRNPEQSRSYGTQSEQRAVEDSGRETFYADESVSWQSLGASNEISRALINAGLQKPSLIQASCIPRILSGRDVVMAAETGSGKTHGYLIPIIDKLHRDSTRRNEDDEGDQYSLILCPNGTLCEQVSRMVNSLRNDNGQSLSTVAALGGQQGNWPVRNPDILVCTPVAFMNMVRSSKISPGRSVFIRRAKYVVFDEADLLLCGGFKNEVMRLIHMLRCVEKERSSSNEEDEGSLKKREGRVKSGENRKQYIFVAATLPVNGKETAGGILKRMFRDASWISGSFLHHHSPRLQQEWVEVTEETQLNEVVTAVRRRRRNSERTMIFANTVFYVEAVVAALERASIRCLRYTSNFSHYERSKALMDFQLDDRGILICTDAASRGVDIPNVAHVIQAQFPLSAVDFLHRTGRTARAGLSGHVTSLFNQSDRDLVDAVRRAALLGQPVESAFSRKRSFRKKLRKLKSQELIAEENLSSPVSA